MSVSNSRIKRFLACALAVVMMLMCWFPTYAKAVVLEGAAILTLDLFINILIIAMLGSEMTGALQGAAAADDMKPKDWLSLQINKYTNGQGLSEPGLLNMFQAGVKYWQDGTVVIGEQMADWITDFQNWLWGNTDSEDSPNMEQYAEQTSEQDIYTNGQGVYLAKIIMSENLKLSNGNYVDVGYITGITNGSRRFLYSENGSEAFATLYNGSLRVKFLDNRPLGGYGYSSKYGLSNQINYSLNSINDNSWHSLTVANDYTYNLPVSTSNPNVVTDISALTPMNQNKGDPDKLNKALLGVAAGAAAAGVAIGLPDSVLVGRDGETLPADATVDIADYVSAVADAAAGVYYPTMPVAIPGEGVVDVPVSIPADTTVPVDGVDDVGVDEATGEAAGDVAGEASGDVTGTGDYTVALSDFFPFCIPFDLLAMLKKFQASAEAPKVDVPFNIQGNVTVFTVDLSPWDPVARVLRTMEKIAFAIGLAWATKNLIQGGS